MCNDYQSGKMDEYDSGTGKSRLADFYFVSSILCPGSHYSGLIFLERGKSLAMITILYLAL